MKTVQSELRRRLALLACKCCRAAKLNTRSDSASRNELHTDVAAATSGGAK